MSTDEVNSQLIINICTDPVSTEMYYNFVRLMVRKGITCCFRMSSSSHPNMVILGDGFLKMPIWWLRILAPTTYTSLL